MSGSLFGWDDMSSFAREYLEMSKDVVDGVYERRWPLPGEKLCIELISEEERATRFFLDVFEGRRSSSVILGLAPDRKATMQTRRAESALLRVDYTDEPETMRHRNPDGSVVVGSHVHLDLDGTGAKWAVPLSGQSVIVADGQASVPGLFWGFQDACRITNRLSIEQSLGV